MSNNLLRLFDEQGQSPWLDNLQRGYITSGHLNAVIDSGIRGLTSNPTIFQKAIQGSTDYDEQFARVTSAGVGVEDAYWDLVTTDIDGALAAFEPLYDSSNGLDGFVSVEVDPSLATDGVATLSAAEKLHERISRPNVMIKIPATIEGIPAIESMIAQGCNINVTLIFSLERYQDVMNAYISGLETRLAQKLPISTISSVASFSLVVLTQKSIVVSKRMALQMHCCYAVRQQYLKPDSPTSYLSKPLVDQDGSNLRKPEHRYSDLFGRRLQQRMLPTLTPCMLTN